MALRLDLWLQLAGTIGKFRGLAGIDAALLLLEGMKAGIYGTQAGPDIFTYTTVIVGIARATVSHDFSMLQLQTGEGKQFL